MDEDKNHVKLITDLEKLLEQAKSFDFHDFKSTYYPAPKMALSNKLRVMRNDTLNGKYDN